MSDQYVEISRASKEHALRNRSLQKVIQVAPRRLFCYMLKGHPHIMLTKQRREEEKIKKQAELQKKRIEQLEREDRRWQQVESQQRKQQQRYESEIQSQLIGAKRTANRNGMAYNPINLQYDTNSEGQKLKRRDEEAKIRGFVRAHNMDNRGNSKYNPLTGEDRLGIETVVPTELTERYSNRLNQHYDYLRLKIPSTAQSSSRPGISYSKYY